MGSFETDEQIIARKERERAVAKAWREFGSSSKLARRLASTLPAANPRPKSIIVTRNRRVDKHQQDWKSWGTPGRRP